MHRTHHHHHGHNHGHLRRRHLRRYLSALLLSLSTMLHLEQPHVNVLSKMDLIKQYGKLGGWRGGWVGGGERSGCTHT